MFRPQPGPVDGWASGGGGYGASLGSRRMRAVGLDRARQRHHFAEVKDEADRRYGLERYSKETHRLYGVAEKRLSEVPYFAGEALSIADFAILGWAWRHPRHEVDLASYPHVKRWYDGLMDRPAVQRGLSVDLKTKR